MTKKYQIVRANSLGDLEEEVGIQITQGWQPQGGLVFHPGTSEYAQAMTLAPVAIAAALTAQDTTPGLLMSLGHALSNAGAEMMHGTKAI